MYPRQIDKKNYLGMNAGYSYVPTKLSNADYLTKPKGSLFGTIRVGYIINPKFRTDITATYRGNYSSPAPERQNIANVAFMLNGYFHLRNSQKIRQFSPYLMAGLGYGINKAGDVDINDGPSGDVTHIGGTQKENLVWQIGVGSLFKLNKNIDADFMYKFVYLGKVSTTNVVKKSTESFPKFDPSVRGTLKAHEFSIGIYFKFN